MKMGISGIMMKWPWSTYIKVIISINNKKMLLLGASFSINEDIFRSVNKVRILEITGTRLYLSFFSFIKRFADSLNMT